MAMIAALSGAGSFSQAVTTWDKSGLNGTEVCESLCESPSEFPCKIWRREGDSNPRYGFWPYNGLANHRLQPLGHLSKPLIILAISAIGQTARFALAYRLCIL